MYFLVTLAIVVSVWWRNPHLDSIFGNTVRARGSAAFNETSGRASNRTSSPTILAMESLNPDLAGFVNGCLIFCVLSAANSAIYFSSRTIWGLTHRLQGRNHVSKWFKRLSPLMASSGAPIRTIFFALLIFFWIPFLELVPSTERVCHQKSTIFRGAILTCPAYLLGPASDVALVQHLVAPRLARVDGFIPQVQGMVSTPQ